MKQFNDLELQKNASGYPDPTAYNAIKNIEEEKNKSLEYERFHKLLHTIFYLCNLAGFKIDGHIVLIDKKSGRIWK